MSEISDKSVSKIVLRNLLPHCLIRMILECTRMDIEVLLVCNQFYRTQWRYYDHKVRLSWTYLRAVGMNETYPTLPTSLYWSSIIQYQNHDRERTPFGILTQSKGPFIQTVEGVKNAVHRMLHNSDSHPALAALSNSDVHMMKHFETLGCMDGVDYNVMLRMASRRGLLEAVQYLLEKGADVEAADNYNGTPLHWAAMKGHLQIFQYLLEKGANVDAVDYGDGTSLHLAAWNGQLQIVQYLLEKGANMEAADDYNRTPLHWAAWNGQLQIVQRLLEKGANVEAVDNDNETPLQLAMNYPEQFPKIVELLQAYMPK